MILDARRHAPMHPTRGRGKDASALASCPARAPPRGPRAVTLSLAMVILPRRMTMFLRSAAIGVGLLLGALPGALPARAVEEPALVPTPASLQLDRGAFALRETMRLRVAADADEVRDVAALLTERVARVCQRRLTTIEGDDADIVFALDTKTPNTSNESYRLRVGRERITLSAAEIAGLRAGSQTLLQLLCAPNAKRVPALRIEDAPAFAWRGAMLDSARHFQSIEFIKRFLDTMALHKLNVLHWHLTDDQAWRLEIKRYPRLTEIGAWRVPAGDAARADIDPATNRPRQYGGYYTQDQAREIVAYARRLGITVVPEIEMPGHASAALAAYPELGALPGTVTSVPADWGIYGNAFGFQEPTFAFLENVLRETLAIFPSPYIHIGGDEVEPKQWRESAAGKALIAELGEEGAKHLQARFTERIARFVEAQGRRIVGWDEILSPGLAPGAIVMSWRGIDGAITAAQQGHDTVLAPWPTLYFDNRQAGTAVEPPGRTRTITLADVYAFDPQPAALSAEQRRHVMGVQGNVWVEHIRTEARVAHMAWPRLAAIAELGWTPGERRAWPDFARRVPTLWPAYAAFGITPADSAYAPEAEIARDKDRARVTLRTQTDVGEIRYTRDGSEPRASSSRYRKLLDLKLPVTLRARTFLDDQPISAIREYPIRADDVLRRDSRDLERCGDAIGLMLEDDAPREGERAVFTVDLQNPCWYWRQAPLAGVTGVRARVGQVPFNFQIGDAVKKIKFGQAETIVGELEIHLDTCDGPLLTRLPLAEAAKSFGVSEVRGAFPAQDRARDVCLRFAQPALEPFWLIDRLEWERP